MVHTNPEIETSNLILDFEFDQHLGSHKHVINIIMRFRDMGCYTREVEGGGWRLEVKDDQRKLGRQVKCVVGLN
jgi:hypothetical protein